MRMVKEIHVRQRVAYLTLKAAETYNISPERCHIGHLVLQAMLEAPDMIHQIDGVTGATETHISVATRSTQLASAMANSGLTVGDHVVNMGHNHLDLCIPFYACKYNGYSKCSVDPRITLSDMISLFGTIDPKIVFCPKERFDDVTVALQKNSRIAEIVVFDDKQKDIKAYITKYKGTENNFRPAEFDAQKTVCWLMLTSGTTGLPKVALVPYATLLNALCSWWCQFTERWKITMAMTTIQWMSSLLFFVSTPLMKNTRLQASQPITPELIIMLINKFKPNVTAWSPFLLAQFLRAAGDKVDLTCFKYIAIGGSALDKPLHEQFSKKCNAYLYLVYGMTELLVPVFDFNKSTPFGSTGKPYDHFEYKLVDDDGSIVDKPNQTGELWVKGDAFFKGYLNNKEETENVLTNDGWFKTGDNFYKDENDYYYFVERKRLMIKYTGFWIAPLQLEEVIKKHPGVAEACVVGIPNKETNQTPVAVIVKKNGCDVKPQEIFDLVRNELPQIKQLHGGLFFVNALPETPSGKINRGKVKEMALVTDRILPVKR